MGWIKGQLSVPPYSAHFWFFRIEQSRVRYMGIQYLTFCHYFLDKQNCLWRRRSRKSRNFFDFGQKFPLPQFCKYGIRFEFGLGTVFSVCHISGTHLIWYVSSTTRTYCDILFVQYLDRMYFIFLPEPSQKFTAADQISADRNQFSFIMVAQEPIVTYPDKSFRRNMHQETADEFGTFQG